MNNTEHLDLKKPDYTDFADIFDINDNMDTLDEAIHDTKDSTATFTSSDVADGSANAWTSITPMASGETHKSLLGKISQALRNLRFLWKLIGNTDISAIGNGTITNALSVLNANGVKTITRSGTTFTVTRNDNTTFTFEQQDNNTWTANSASAAGYVAKGVANKVWKCDANGAPAWRDDANTTYGLSSTSGHGLLRQLSGNTAQYMRGDGTWQTPPNTNTWKQNTNAQEGYVLKGVANKVWKCDANGTPAWRDDANTTYGLASTSANGLLRALSNNTGQYLRGDGTWQTPPNTTYNISYGYGSGTINSTYVSSGTITWYRQICHNSAIVTMIFDVTLKGSYSSNNSCIFGSGIPKAIGQPIAMVNGESGSDGLMGAIIIQDSTIKPWYVGTVKGHWYGSITYLAFL